MLANPSMRLVHASGARHLGETPGGNASKSVDASGAMCLVHASGAKHLGGSPQECWQIR